MLNFESHDVITLLSFREYYFSSDNLQKDFFLRRKMLEGGWIPIALVASFHRVTKLTADLTSIVSVSNIRTNFPLQYTCLTGCSESSTPYYTIPYLCCLVLQSVKDSKIVELSEDGLKMRPKDNPAQWPIEEPAFVTSNLKVDVPEFVPGQLYYPIANTGMKDQIIL